MAPNQIELPQLDKLNRQVWNQYWAELERRLGSLFALSEAGQLATSYLAGLLSPAQRKNSRQVVEIRGYSTLYGFQHLLAQANWDADALRDRLYTYLTAYLDDDTAIGMLVETTS